MKTFYLFLLIFFIVGCSGNKKPKIKYTNENTQYRIVNVNVKLISKCQNDKFPDQNKLLELITK